MNTQKPIIDSTREYYYLTSSFSNPKGKVSINEMIRDLQKGVKRLSEHSYTPHWGSTSSSMRFMNAVIQLLGIEGIKGKRAILKYNAQRSFELHIYTHSGYELVFYGVSGGYFGEGTRGCHDILKACGFSNEQCQKPFKEENFECRNYKG